MASEPREYVEAVEKLTERFHVWIVGRLRPETVAGIAVLEEDNLEVVLTEPRWAYICAKSENRQRFLDVAVGAVLAPDEVHRDRNPFNAIFYKRLGKRGYIKVVVWLQLRKGDRQHSIGDFYPRDVRKVRRDRAKWLVWQKE